MQKPIYRFVAHLNQEDINKLEELHKKGFKNIEVLRKGIETSLKEKFK